MHALRYFFSEAVASLWRGRRAALLAVLTIAASLFVLGVFLLLNVNLQRLVSRWSESAELSVYLEDDATAVDLTNIDEMVAGSGVAAERRYVSKQLALERFGADFPDLAGAAGALESHPFPASFDLRLKPGVREATGAVDGLVAALRTMPGVADVRYDREWLERLNAVVRGGRVAGGIVALLLALAAAMTVANVVRLAATARRAEIEIMQLVGAPFAYVRGPFVAEGILQGGIGALVALAALGGAYLLMRMRYGGSIAEALGGPVTFLPVQAAALLIAGGMLLGCVGGYVVARRVR
ncbi:MAG TPA: ABC transporter permease [Vicinamibacterales bacterium]|nr:ABC transporter permease [Vicinamibacterales bacterium]